MKKNKTKRWNFNLTIYFTLVNLFLFTVVSIIAALISYLLNHIFYLSFAISETVYTIILSIIMGGVITIFLYRKILAPIGKLSQAMSEVTLGNFNLSLNSKSKIDEIQKLYRNFNLMVGELATTETLQSDFVSNVSHEFKTPLSAIEGYATLLQGDEALTSDQNEYIEKILLNTRRLTGLVSNILLLSKVENQVIPLKIEEFSLDEQIREQIVSLEPKWTEKEIELEADLESTTYKGHELLLSHVWLNLIDNAIKFNPTRGSLHIGLRASEQNVLVSVRDSGCGVSERDKKRIFDKFYQTNSINKDGNGLGLSLVSNIISMHNGNISVENCQGGGCKFSVILPRNQAS